MQALVDELYTSFVAKVAAARRMTEEQAKVHATGEVFTGRKGLGSGPGGRAWETWRGPLRLPLGWLTSRFPNDPTTSALAARWDPGC